MTPEAKVKKEVKKILAKYKIWYFMPSMSGFGRAGIPDFICCIRGRLLGIETKAKGGKLTRLQEIEQQAINDAGGVCIVMRLERLPALEILIEIMLRSPIIGTENASIPATEAVITEVFVNAQNVIAQIEKDAEISATALGMRSAQHVLPEPEVPPAMECRHGTSFRYACEECDAEQCSHGKRIDEPCEECEAKSIAPNSMGVI